MYLEDIAKSYGMIDYYDIITGRIYELSKAEFRDGDENVLSVPIKDICGNLVGHAYMADVLGIRCGVVKLETN